VTEPDLFAASNGIHPALLEELWRECGAAAWGLTKPECDEILTVLGKAQNFGLAAQAIATRRQQAAWFRGLKLSDLVLARACAAGNERAWERFVATYEQPLIRAAIAITGSETLGRELAGQLYAELYGLTVRDGQRRCPMDSYRGRGSLIGWLRATLAQRHVDHYRRNRREISLEEEPEILEATAADQAPETQPASLHVLAEAIQEALRRLAAEERFLLASYYLDGRTLAEIGQVLKVHEATVSRKLRRIHDGVRKQTLRQLERLGLSRREAREALGTDPRDLEINLKKLLQNPFPETFPEKAER
jgi:RNA polymerase sigma-70 factor (ECF subfamily)